MSSSTPEQKPEALCTISSGNRLLSKQRYFEEFIGAYGAQDRSVHVVHEDPSTEATQKLPKERMFRNKSNVS
jgi:hypothetical protein